MKRREAIKAIDDQKKQNQSSANETKKKLKRNEIESVRFAFEKAV